MIYTLIPTNSINCDEKNYYNLDKNIFFDDLVETAILDEKRKIEHLNRKYIPPKINKRGEILENEIYLCALKKAKIPEILIEIDKNNNENETQLFFPYKPNQVKKIIDNYIFFYKNNFNDKPNQLKEGFIQFEQDCREVVNNQSKLKSQLQLDNIKYEQINNIVIYSIFGKCESLDAKNMLNKPIINLESKLEEYFGLIRSVNGIVKR